MPNSTTSISNLFADTTIHYATSFDIPFIFDLIVRGSMDGSFAGSLISSSGYVTILASLFASLHFFSKLKFFTWRSFKQTRRAYKELLTFSDQSEPIGFLQITTYPDVNGRTYKVIDICAVKYELRRHGYGKHMISLFLDTQPANIQFLAYCNSYAKNMQRILRQLQFTRTSVGQGFNLYTLGNFTTEELKSFSFPPLI